MTTGKMTTIARPYVAAAFEFALVKKDLSAWTAMLNAAADVSRDPSVIALLGSPTATSEQIAKLYEDVLAKLLDEPKKNFLRLLAENDRLAVLPDIAELFKAACAAQEKSITVQVTSAAGLDNKYQETLTKVLSDRFQRNVELECEIDPTLLGGAIIRAGDTVIDGSIRGKLTRLNEFI